MWGHSAGQLFVYVHVSLKMGLEERKKKDVFIWNCWIVTLECL